MFRSVTLAAAVGAAVTWSASAATIKRVQDDPNGPATIFVEGLIEFGDDRKFVDQIVGIDTATVVLVSGGGSVDAGIRIGRAIQLKGFDTLVPDDYLCASSCAFAWLAGQRRFMGPKASIGFHAAYEIKDGVPTERGSANAVVGAYLNSLSLSQAAIYFLTSAPPERLNYLTLQNATEHGIPVYPFEAPPIEFAPLARLGSESAIYYFQGAQGQPGVATEGTVAWSEVAREGVPAIQGVLKAVGQDTTTTVTIYKNGDSSLPASHVVEIKFSGEIGRSPVQRIPALVLKKTEQARGQPLTGVEMPVTGDLFWIALSDDTVQATHNIQLLRAGSWFDLPILFNDGTRALLTFEKGKSGDPIFSAVIAHWEEETSEEAVPNTATTEVMTIEPPSDLPDGLPNSVNQPIGWKWVQVTRPMLSCGSKYDTGAARNLLLATLVKDPAGSIVPGQCRMLNVGEKLLLDGDQTERDTQTAVKMWKAMCLFDCDPIRSPVYAPPLRTVGAYLRPILAPPEWNPLQKLLGPPENRLAPVAEQAVQKYRTLPNGVTVKIR